MKSSLPLTGKRALIAGASGGIEQSIAWALFGAGAEIAVTARQVDALETTTKVVQELAKRMGNAAASSRPVPIAMDGTSVASIRNGVNVASEALGGLDILVNSAGVQSSEAALDVEEDSWDEILDINLKGAFFTAQAAARIMANGRGGSILNICASGSFRGVPMEAAYSSSKAGLLGMTRTLAAEWGRYAIRVNALAPGDMHTDMTEPHHLVQAWRAKMLERSPISRLGQPDDLQGAAVFLVSDDARFITGACLPVDGGFLASLLL
ncbi:MAG: SDR family oxidoreductase [Pseudomonadota bacterium]